jgi:hypothetical protein
MSPPFTATSSTQLCPSSSSPKLKSKKHSSDFIKKYEVIFPLIHSSFIDLATQERKDNP